MRRHRKADTSGAVRQKQSDLRGIRMRLIKITSSLGFCVLFVAGAGAQQTSPDIQNTVDIMVRLCVAGGHIQALVGGGAGGADVSLRRLDVTGHLEGQITVNRSNAEGLVNGIDNALSQVAAAEADKVRDCLGPVRQRVLDILLPAPKAEASSPPPPQQLQSPQPKQTAAASNLGPVTWDLNSQLLVVTGGGPTAMINSVLLQGTSTASVLMKEAYAVSGLTGHKQALMANVQSQGRYYPVNEVDIPPKAPVWLELLWKPPLSLNDFLDKWGQFRVTVVYDDGTTYQREFDENYIRHELQQIIPSVFGPHVTPRDKK